MWALRVYSEGHVESLTMIGMKLCHLGTPLCKAVVVLMASVPLGKDCQVNKENALICTWPWLCAAPGIL